MPVLPNPRHEKFAQSLAKGKAADEAYQEAGYKPNRRTAATLEANQSISDRVAKLQAGAAQIGRSIEQMLAQGMRKLINLVGG